ncbi:MAG: hypothetical protein ACK4VY_09910 [Brevundimonas sp.]
MTPFTLFAENGLVELVQMLALALGALAFGLSATVTRAPGGPLLMLGATTMGVAALREFDLETGSAVLAYFASPLPRTQLAVLGLLGAAWLALRRPLVGPRRHLAAVAPLAPALLAAAGLVAIGDGLEKLDLANPAGLALEELLELVGYALATAVGLRTAVRVIRRPGRPPWRRVTLPEGPALTPLAPGTSLR